MISRLVSKFDQVNKSISRKTSNPSPQLRSQITKFYIFCHYLVGFFTLWMCKYKLDQMHDIASDVNWNLTYNKYDQLAITQKNLLLFVHENSFLFQSGVETAFLIVCVIWGNLGWDRIKNIREDSDGSKFFKYFISETAAGMGGFGLLAATLTVFTMVMSGTWWHGLGKMEVFWFSVFSVCMTILVQIRRASTNTENYGSDATKRT